MSKIIIQKDLICLVDGFNLTKRAPSYGALFVVNLLYVSSKLERFSLYDFINKNRKGSRFLCIK